MTVLLPYHQRIAIQIAHVTEFRAATGTAMMQRWYPVFLLLREVCFTDYQVGALIGLRDEYEQGVGRKG